MPIKPMRYDCIVEFEPLKENQLARGINNFSNQTRPDQTRPEY